MGKVERRNVVELKEALLTVLEAVFFGARNKVLLVIETLELSCGTPMCSALLQGYS